MNDGRVGREYAYAAAIPATPPYIPGRSNPAVVVGLPTRARVRVTLESTKGRSATASGVEELVRRYFERFLNELYVRLGVEASVDAELLECVGCGPAFKYVALTNAALEAMGGGLTEDVLEAATTIDEEIGLGYGVRALRLAPVKRTPYVWRFGEGAIECTRPAPFRPRLVRAARLAQEAECPLPDLLTHVAGVLAVRFFNALEAGATAGEVAPLVRLSNAIWHAIYGVPAVTSSPAGLILITESLPPYVELYLLEDTSGHEGSQARRLRNNG